jgi:hypothetical protein
VALGVAVGLYVFAWVSARSGMQTISSVIASYLAIAVAGLWLIRFQRCGQLRYSLSKEALTAETCARIMRDRTVIRREDIAAIRLARNAEGQFALEVLRGQWRSSLVKTRSADAAWELAAILRHELNVPAFTPEENAIGAGNGQVSPDNTIEPAKHYVELKREGETVVIRRNATGLRRISLVLSAIGSVTLGAGIVIPFVFIPMASGDDRSALQGISVVSALFGAVLLFAVVVDATDRHQFEITQTHLIVSRWLPWGVWTRQWDLRQIADVRIEPPCMLLLDDSEGKVHRLVASGHAASVRYVAALLRKHLAERIPDVNPPP